MKKHGLSLALALGLALATPAAPPAAAADAVTPAESFGDWHVRCREIVKGEKACALHQRLVSEKTGKHVMALALAGNREGTAYRLTAIMPLGLDVPAGITGRIGDGPEFSYQLQTCIMRGCIASIELSPEALRALMAAGSVTTRFSLRGVDQPITVSASLKGLPDGFKALRAQ
ncbi:MAG: invasion associated locus B family protein [Aestuariivirga sp.]|uniref:invasion associated locus B family protein n=1 Tax=Aestuariivirga sp. TaxID=2650926 RepID=UPI0038D012B1